MATIAAENYVKHIFVAAQEHEGEVVPMGRVSKALDVTPGTATSMVKHLAESGLLRYEPRQGVQLTASGREMALQILRRHRLIEYFLAETLKMDWGEVHEEAERLEHAISDRLLERLDEFLGHPKFDPHGDAIPSATGAMVERTLLPLSECAVGAKGRVARLSDDDPGFLKFARERKLIPGVRFKVRARDNFAACVELLLGTTDSLTLGIQAAEKVWVEL